MEKNKSLVIQAKFIEEWKGKDGKPIYNHGVAFKNKDVGIFYCDTKEQDYFVEGHEVEYMIERNEKEPKKSKIKPITEEKSKSKHGVYSLDIHEYVQRKTIDAVTFSASYAKDMCVANDKIKFAETADKILEWQLDKLKIALEQTK